MTIPGYYSRYPQEYKGKLPKGKNRMSMNTLHTNEGILYYELKKVDNKRIVYIYSENKPTQEEKDHKLELERERTAKEKLKQVIEKPLLYTKGQSSYKSVRTNQPNPKPSYDTFKYRINQGLPIEVALLTTGQYQVRKQDNQ